VSASCGKEKRPITHLAEEQSHLFGWHSDGVGRRAQEQQPEFRPQTVNHSAVLTHRWLGKRYASRPLKAISNRRA
jgi:hypothetical protein